MLVAVELATRGYAEEWGIKGEALLGNWFHLWMVQD